MSVTLEGSFPNPSQTLTATVRCDQGVTSRDGNLFREWMTRTGSTVTGNQLTTPWITLSCEQGRLTAKADSIQAILKLMTTSVSVGQLGAEQNNRTGKASLSFLEQSGCVYPEVRYKCYWNYLLLSVEKGVVKRDNPEYDFGYGSLVGAKQGTGPVAPVFFEGKSTPFQYDPNLPVEVYVKVNNIGYWQYLSINEKAGSLTWWKSNDAPQ
ncbi:hypothetical protein [Deinococcus roseus]|uniref:Uncharacterized protein n=1 Tax=Deinococcus roseus TaxID=392414 RepID=A0ABQ2DIY1_9DEIO|nr:hypothetical protein [Deinococcus roseus]GGJ59605.1 hypothetical protein GCM10008938_52180 [Deinococcus roseus]